MVQPSAGERLRNDLAELVPSDPQYAVRAVDRLLAGATECNASDIHLLPTPDGLKASFRIDGVVLPVALFPPALAVNVVGRLKVLAELLTYRTDVPQEGRIRAAGGDLERRVSTFPTLHGERAVVRLFASGGKYLRLDDLGLPADVLARLRQALAETSGAVLIAGPAGSGKTTTAYACLRELVDQSRGSRSLLSLEDPIEVAVPGVAQSQVNPTVGYDLANGLKFLVRQDPEVILVGEIRDRATAESAFQAALTGHLVLSTFHAGSAAGAISRLADMGIEPYMLRSGVLAILSQRLVRRLCICAQPASGTAQRLGLPVESYRVPAGCDECGHTGYRGRLLLMEMLTAEASDLGRAILSRSDAPQLEQLAAQAGMVTRWQRACQAIEDGLTSPAEVRRVLGLSG